MALIASELSFCLLVLRQHSFHYIMQSLMFRLWGPVFLATLSVGLYSLIDFPIENKAHKQLGIDSFHCFHFYGTMMTSPTAALPACARLLSLNLINWEVAVNYQSIFWVLIGRMVSPRNSAGMKRHNERSVFAAHWLKVMEDTLKWEWKQDKLFYPQMLVSVQGQELHFSSGNWAIKGCLDCHLALDSQHCLLYRFNETGPRQAM